MDCDFKNMLLRELQECCRENGWRGHSKCKTKKEMIIFCENKYKEEDNESICSVHKSGQDDCDCVDDKEIIKELQEKIRLLEIGTMYLLYIIIG